MNTHTGTHVYVHILLYIHTYLLSMHSDKYTLSRQIHSLTHSIYYLIIILCMMSFSKAVFMQCIIILYVYGCVLLLCTGSSDRSSDKVQYYGQKTNTYNIIIIYLDIATYL